MPDRGKWLSDGELSDIMIRSSALSMLERHGVGPSVCGMAPSMQRESMPLSSAARTLQGHASAY